MYFEIPKAACSTLKQLVLQLELGKTLSDSTPFKDRHSRRDMAIHDRDNIPVPSLLDLDSERQREVLESPDFLRLIVVRNPYTRLVSAWQNKVLVCEPDFEYFYEALRGGLPGIRNKQFIPFAEFVDYIFRNDDLDVCNPHWCRQVTYSFYSSMNFNCVGHMEDLAGVLARLQHHIGSDKPLDPPVGNSSGFSKDPMFTQELADRIYGQYKQDFDTLGYDRESWPRVSKGFKIGEEAFLDEIVEKNIVILSLYNEIAELRKKRNGGAGGWAKRLARGLRLV